MAERKMVVAKDDFQIGARHYVAGGTYALPAADVLQVANHVRPAPSGGAPRSTRAISADGVRRA